MAQILILDDEQPLLRSLSMELERAGHECLPAESGRDAYRVLEKHSPDLAILDVQLPDISGLDVLRRLRSELPEVPVLMITAYASVDSAVEAMKEGAIDYIEKPLDLEELLLVVERELGNARLRSEVEAYRRDRSAANRAEIIGTSPALVAVRKTVEQISNLAVTRAAELPTVLILGETGTGKDLLARHIHLVGPLARRPFVSVNCAGLPRDLVESELFGHERGAFTGANQRKQGLFEVAQGGTIYLDEIGDMPSDIQGKLLAVLETKRVRRVGGTREHHVDVRIIAATNRDLEAAIAEGKFRSDLFYRLKVIALTLPPLRERREDIPLLAAHFLERSSARYQKQGLELTESTVRSLQAWRWPGNIREFAHAIEHLVLTSDDGVLAEPHFPGMAPATAPLGGFRFDFDRMDCTLEAVEKALLVDALRHTHNNISEVARLLGVSRGSLRNRLDKWDLQPRGTATDDDAD